jgi:hypothetical protein
MTPDSRSLRDCRSTKATAAVVLVTMLVLGMGLAVALVHAYDTRLVEAAAALQKAAALVEAAQAGPVSPRTQRRFDQHVDKALSSIEEAMGHIVAAGVAADSDGGH